MGNADEISACLDDFVEKVVKKITVNATAYLTKETPIDTGFARSNWVPQIGTEFSGLAGEYPYVDETDKSSGLIDVMSSYTLSKGSVFISNNAEYIQALEDGHSLQAPQGFVLRSLTLAIQKTIVKQ